MNDSFKLIFTNLFECVSALLKDFSCYLYFPEEKNLLIQSKSNKISLNKIKELLFTECRQEKNTKISFSYYSKTLKKYFKIFRFSYDKPEIYAYFIIEVINEKSGIAGKDKSIKAIIKNAVDLYRFTLDKFPEVKNLKENLKDRFSIIENQYMNTKKINKVICDISAEFDFDRAFDIISKEVGKAYNFEGYALFLTDRDRSSYKPYKYSFPFRLSVENLNIFKLERSLNDDSDLIAKAIKDNRHNFIQETEKIEINNESDKKIIDILKIKSFWHHIIHLYSAQLPFTTYCIFYNKIYFRTIECRLAFSYKIIQSKFVSCFCDFLLRL